MNRKWIVLCGLCCLWLTCQQIDETLLETGQVDDIRVLGHAGSGFPSPEADLPTNSWPSIQKAIEGFGLDGVEVDVQLSRDSVLFLYHDPLLSSLTNCGGCVADLDSVDLIRCRYRNTYGRLGSSLVPLEQLMAAYAQRQPAPLLLLDLKPYLSCQQKDDPASFAQRVFRQLNLLAKRYPEWSAIYVETLQLPLLNLMAQEETPLKLMLSGRPGDILIVEAEKYKAAALGFKQQEISREEAAAVRDAGFELILWDIRIRAAAVEAINKAPDMILTDNPVLTREVLGR